MSTPELIPEAPRSPEPVSQRVEQPVISETIQSLGITVPPQAPKPVVSDTGQVMAQPVVDPTIATPQVLSVPQTIATSKKELEKGAEGPANLSITWLDRMWLRNIGKAVLKGWKIVFGQK